MHNSKSFPFVLTFLFIFQILFGYAQTSTNSESIFAESYSKEEIISQCIFYGGDSLSGFDMDKAYDEAVYESGINLLIEVKSYIHHKQIAFVKQKYNIPDEKGIPHRQPIDTSNLSAISCNNSNFEYGDFGNWSGAFGYNTMSYQSLVVFGNYVYSLGDDLPVTACAYHTIVSSISDTDYYGGFEVVPYQNGGRSARLGGNNQNRAFGQGCSNLPNIGTYSRGEYLETIYSISSSTEIMELRYAVVLNTGSISHPDSVEPYFRIEITDSAFNPLPACMQYFQEAESTIPPGYLQSSLNGFDNTPVWYLPWQSKVLNLANYSGSQIYIRFTSAGCAWGAHFAYAYVDIICDPPSINVSSILGCTSPTITLSAPYYPNVTYNWAGPGIVGSNTGQSVLVNAPGFYNVTITPDAGCGPAFGVNIFIPNYSLNISASSTNSLCYGGNSGTATVSVSGGSSPYTYSWSTGDTTQSINNVAAGSYVVTVVDSNGCTSTDTVTITEPPQLTVNLTVTDASCSTCCDGSVLAVASGGVGAYSWNSDCNATCAGLYTCCVTDSNSCVACDTFTISYPTIVSEVVPEGFSIHPNPTSGIFTIETILSSGDIELFNVLGEKVLSKHLTPSLFPNGEGSTVSLKVAPGIYFVRVSDGEKVWTQKVVIE
jgi:hypothetical protein